MQSLPRENPEDLVTRSRFDTRSEPPRVVYRSPWVVRYIGNNHLGEPMIEKRAASSALVCFALTVLATNAEGESADPVAPVRELVRAFEYDEAIERAQAISRDTSVTANQRLEALALVGVIHLIEERQDEAREVFERLLSLDPGSEISDPDLPPRVVEFFREIRSSYEPDEVVEADVDVGDEVAGQRQVTITLSGVSDSVDQLRLHVRGGESGSFRSVAVSGSGLDYGAVIAPEAGGDSIDFYLEVLAPSGHILTNVGTEDAPQTVEPIGEGSGDEDLEDIGDRERHWYTSWWFWTIIGVVVASGIVTAVVLTRPDEHQDGTLGSVQMPLLGSHDLEPWR